MVNSNGRPDKPLIVKCTFERWNKRISFASARNCTFELLKTKVEECFSLSASPFAIAYKDDDGEVTDITTEGDLSEAIQYFQAGADEVSSSAASILSGRSFGSRKITLRVHVVVDYDGPSLSDTSSLVSLDDYKARSESISLSGPPSIIEPDDDSMTVSSRDIIGSSSNALSGHRLTPNSSSHTANQGHLTSELSWNSQSSRPGRSPSRSRKLPTPPGTYTENDPFSDDNSLPEDPTAVFERLKLEEAMRDDTSSIGPEQLASYNRGTEWLRDQNERAIHSLRAGAPDSTDSESSSQFQQPEQFDGDLALERDTRGKYYYTYTSGSSGASQSQELGDTNAILEPTTEEDRMRKPRPSSRQLDWLATQQAAASKPSSSQRALEHEPIMEENIQVPPELLQYLPIPNPSADDMTDCSNCGRIIESIRYVCAVCGEKAPSSSKGKGKDIVDHQHSQQHLYPPQRFHQHSPSSSSVGTHTGSSDTLLPRGNNGNYTFLSSNPSFNSGQSGSSASFSEGYELCAMCIELVGVTHAIEAGLEHTSSPVTSPSSPEDAQRALQWRRSAPRQKGRIRHAYQEKMWGHTGWEDVDLDESGTIQCSGCQIITPPRKCYRCASCVNYHLCKACYSQVHDVHPSHVFLVWPERHGPHTTRTSSDPELHVGSPGSADNHEDEEISLKHPGVKCAHCMQDIVGARFHCAICDAVDICSNCESAGLPGNLDSADGGHSSSHIVIKIPYPLELDELEMASRRAKNLWTVRDAANVGLFSTSKAGSVVSTSYDGTVLGHGAPSMDHRISCSSCSKPIIGVRYQCGSCPSSPISYNLCSECEGYSYLVHDPMHAFFKLPRPVDRPLENRNPFLPLLYKQPVGKIPGLVSNDDPKAYLNYLVHSSAICDRCMTCIQGAWFRCAYCGKDLCDSCQDVDTHNDSHFFMVFKAVVDMQVLKDVADIERPRPIVDYAVYRS